MKKLIFIVLGLIILNLESLMARENVGSSSGKMADQQTIKAIASACSPAKGKRVFELNNVRTTILTGGDMWWETGGSSAKYEIPKGSKCNSLFAGALWIGGLDAGGGLKIAAMTYRQNGNDFWPGTIDTINPDQVAGLDAGCNYYDKHFTITRKQVDDYIDWNKNPSAHPDYTVPPEITNWPAMPYFANESRALAPYHDGNHDGMYNPRGTGDPAFSDVVDYPNYNVSGASCDPNFIFGDETLWWVFNDVGSIHSETDGQPIGLEIQAQAFAFLTNDELNNMTFYKYKIVNRSSFQLAKTYFGQWVDADLGNADDDYVGCDVARGLGYCYNGDNFDDDARGNLGYHDEPAAVGIDFFEGPVADLNDSLDNDRDGCVDGTKDGASCKPETQLREKIIMSKFVYYNNDGTQNGNPSRPSDFYNYLSGKWRDGSDFRYGGDAYNEPGLICDFMFPGSSDTVGWGVGGTIQNPNPQPDWSESSGAGITTPNKPADRRFLQSAGPFTLEAGALNYITVGAVWARAAKGSPASAAVQLMQKADEKAQSLFNNCFKVLDGPDAPDLTIQELDKELILQMSPRPFTDPAAPYKTGLTMEDYHEVDAIIPTTYTLNTYSFEGYQVFQLKDSSVSVTDLNNTDKARLVKQMDIKNDVTQLVNFEFDNKINGYVPEEKVNGEDKGIVHSFNITSDLFALGDPKLINHKPYYYMAVAYAYNQYLKYDQNNTLNINGQKKPYFQGRKNVKRYTGIPHIPSAEAYGTQQNSSYGTTPKIKRIEGWGNGGLNLDLTPETVNKILTNSSNREINPEYQNGRGPILIKVIDPLNVPSADFTFKMLDTVTPGNLTDAYWSLTNNTTGQVRYSNKTIALADECLIPEWGISVTVQQVSDVGTLNANGLPTIDKNGLIEGKMSFSDVSKRWLEGLPDNDAQNPFNWIRAGKINNTDENNTVAEAFDDMQVPGNTPPVFYDPNQDFEKIEGGWAPYVLCASREVAPGANGQYRSLGGPKYGGWGLSNPNAFVVRPLGEILSSVDVVITSDKSKWSRVPVLEESDDQALAIGQADKLNIRNSPSVDKNGLKAGDSGYNSAEGDLVSTTGMGWFPGYAINVETGERLNLAFGEDSRYHEDNGDDMIWNPTARATLSSEYVFGGRHYIYVFGHIGDPPGTATSFDFGPIYDSGEYLRQRLGAGLSTFELAQTFRDCMWASIPLLADNYYYLSVSGRNINIPTDVTVRLRVQKGYHKGYSTQIAGSPGGPKAILQDTAVTPQNNNLPMYTFSTADIATKTRDTEVAKSALDIINVVPNPYYAYSSYEANRLDNRIKITNLPEKATVSIYSLNGTLIRRMKVDHPETDRNKMEVAVTSLDWDLKNQVGVPVSGGLYIIHIDAPGVGEKILKWFGVMRPIDLETY